MAKRNEFGVESSDGGGFGFSADDDGFEAMFEEATAASVADDEISEPVPSRRSQRAQREEEPYAPEEPVRPQAPEPVESFEQPSDEFGATSFEEVESDAPEVSVEELLRDPALTTSVPDFGFNESENQEVISVDNDFNDFGNFEEPENTDTVEWTDPALDQHYSPDLEGSRSFEPTIWPEPQPSFTPDPESTLEPSFYPEPVAEVTPVAIPEPEPVSVPVATAPITVQAPVATPVPPSEGDVDYIERVILTSDAIRDLQDADAKAVNMFITAGQPVDSHQELVLTALRADRQILKTADAILSAKSKTSVDRAFFILGLDESTFVDFGKILSHDLESTETVLFEGDRLQYARRLVDVVDNLADVSISRFEAVKAVLGAGEPVS